MSQRRGIVFNEDQLISFGMLRQLMSATPVCSHSLAQPERMFLRRSESRIDQSRNYSRNTRAIAMGSPIRSGLDSPQRAASAPPCARRSPAYSPAATSPTVNRILPSAYQRPDPPRSLSAPPTSGYAPAYRRHVPDGQYGYGDETPPSGRCSSPNVYLPSSYYSPEWSPDRASTSSYRSETPALEYRPDWDSPQREPRTIYPQTSWGQPRTRRMLPMIPISKPQSPRSSLGSPGGCSPGQEKVRKRVSFKPQPECAYLPRIAEYDYSSDTSSDYI